MFTWAILSTQHDDQILGGRALLAISTIPTSLSILQYFSQSAETGKLILVIMRMASDLKYVRLSVIGVWIVEWSFV